jgi:hypothetical protein
MLDGSMSGPWDLIHRSAVDLLTVMAV